jgi:hypothetical protein
LGVVALVTTVATAIGVVPTAAATAKPVLSEDFSDDHGSLPALSTPFVSARYRGGNYVLTIKSHAKGRIGFSFYDFDRQFPTLGVEVPLIGERVGIHDFYGPACIHRHDAALSKYEGFWFSTSSGGRYQLMRMTSRGTEILDSGALNLEMRSEVSSPDKAVTMRIDCRAGSKPRIAGLIDGKVVAQVRGDRTFRDYSHAGIGFQSQAPPAIIEAESILVERRVQTPAPPADVLRLEETPLLRDRLVPIAGYSYEDPSAAAIELARQSIGFPEELEGWSYHEAVAADGTPVGQLMLYDLDPEKSTATAGQAVLDKVQQALSDDVGSYVRVQDRLDVHGTSVWHLEYHDGSHSYSWVDDGVIVEAFGGSKAQLLPFIAAYIGARHAT